DADGAERAMQRAEELVVALPQPAPDAAFKFNEKRLLLYLSGTLTYLGDHGRARKVQEEALARYQTQPEIVIDPALIRLDQAVGEALDGDASGASHIAIDTLQELPEHHRTQIVLTRARDVVAALPSRAQAAPTVGELRELVNACTAAQG